MSKPRTRKPAEVKARATGKPTYPRPMTPMTAWRAEIRARVCENAVSAAGMAMADRMPAPSLVQRGVGRHVLDLHGLGKNRLADGARDVFPEIVGRLEEQLLVGLRREPPAGAQLRLELSAGPAGIAREKAEGLARLVDELR